MSQTKHIFFVWGGGRVWEIIPWTIYQLVIWYQDAIVPSNLDMGKLLNAVMLTVYCSVLNSRLHYTVWDPWWASYSGNKWQLRFPYYYLNQGSTLFKFSFRVWHPTRNIFFCQLIYSCQPIEISKTLGIFSPNRPTGPMRSSSRDVCPYVSRPFPMQFFCGTVPCGPSLVERPRMEP